MTGATATEAETADWDVEDLPDYDPDEDDSADGGDDAHASAAGPATADSRGPAPAEERPPPADKAVAGQAQGPGDAARSGGSQSVAPKPAQAVQVFAPASAAASSTVAATQEPPALEEMPPEADGESWLAMLRDCQARRLRQDAERSDPEPFQQYMLWSPNWPRDPWVTYPWQSLSRQLENLVWFGGDDAWRSGAFGNGGGKQGQRGGKGGGAGGGAGAGLGGKGVPNQIAAIMAITAPLIGNAATIEALPELLAQEGQMDQILEMAKALAANKSGSGRKKNRGSRDGDGKGHGKRPPPGVQRTIQK